MKLLMMNDKLQLKLISKDYQRIPAIEIFFSKIWWVKIMQNKWVKVHSKIKINRANQNLNQSDQEKTAAIKEFKIFKTTDSKTLNQLMKPETINKTNSIPAKVPITNRFKTMFEAKRIMKIQIRIILIVKVLVRTRVALIEMKIFFVRS